MSSSSASRAVRTPLGAVLVPFVTLVTALTSLGCGSTGSAASIGGTGTNGTGSAGNGGGGQGGFAAGGSGQGGSEIIAQPDAGASNGFAAHIERGHVVVSTVILSCAGDCADVAVVPTGGVPPYTFRWEDGSTDPERHVCPTQTSVYSVSVTDTGSTSGEFTVAPQTVTARFTANVPSCGGAADAGSPADQTAYWVNWASVTPGTPGAGTGTIPAPQGTVQVTYDGEALAQSQPATAPTNDFAPSTTYTSATVANGPPNGGMVAISGGAALTQTIHFSVPVRDPLIAVWSIGFGSLGQSSTWLFEVSPVVESSGPSTSWPFSTLTVSSKMMTGVEGNGIVQLTGTFTSISFTIPTPEGAPGYGGFTVGIRGRG